ncbi:TetR/AcrR family transcriptional regulator [Microbacterium resistens]|uniref:TetR/AcrR family transcriptional regulator n=1 Tax=Microbacterium resistens TaxID=156977 RepID=UPI00082B43D1|nr:TetR/AcrR family transcriptional regulator [Microbacterium resistens]MBW1639513.1 TetR/AcrR family transcriptional regulator [Microbacterium resistens]
MSTGSPADVTRARLLSAAAEEFLERGYAAASLSRIAERIGLTKGAFSHHFPTKDTLIDAMMSHVVTHAPEIVRAAEEAFPESPVRACVAVMGGTAAAAHRDPVVAAAMLLFQDLSVDSRRVAPMRRTMAEMLEGRLRGAVEREGYTLTMPIDDAVQYLVIVLEGFLPASRFPDTFRPRHEPLFVRAALAGIGIGDAEAVVRDALTHLTVAESAD